MRESACLRFVKYTFVFFIFLFLQSVANATSPGDLGFCGGLDQRACCIFEAFPSCDGSYVERNFGDAKCGPFDAFDAGICRSNNPNDKSFCGGAGQRACCLGEAFPSCDTGNIEFDGDETCPPTSDFPGADAGTCYTKTPCGGEGERACDVFEQIAQTRKSCDPGLIELGGCSGIECGELSSGWCYKPTPCGGEGQRACCSLEMQENAVLPASVLPCNTGLTPVVGVAGDATCGASSPLDVPPLSIAAEVLGLPAGAPSFDTCANMTEIKVGIKEPATGWSTQGVTDQTCTSKGYADLHVHMFAHLAHGGGVLAGMPYDPNDPDPDDTETIQIGGINEALKMDYGTDLPLVKGDGTPLLPPIGCDPAVSPFCGDKLFHGAHLITDNAVGAGTHEGAPVCVELSIYCAVRSDSLGRRSNYGSPLFSGWPTWRSTTHQQVYYKWLERAWRGGLRLMGQLAVTSEALCIGSKRFDGTNCSDEMKPVDDQIDATYDFQDYVDTLRRPR